MLYLAKFIIILLVLMVPTSVLATTSGDLDFGPGGGNEEQTEEDDIIVLKTIPTKHVTLQVVKLPPSGKKKKGPVKVMVLVDEKTCDFVLAQLTKPVLLPTPNNPDVEPTGPTPADLYAAADEAEAKGNLELAQFLRTMAEAMEVVGDVSSACNPSEPTRIPVQDVFSITGLGTISATK